MSAKCNSSKGLSTSVFGWLCNPPQNRFQGGQRRQRQKPPAAVNHIQSFSTGFLTHTSSFAFVVIYSPLAGGWRSGRWRRVNVGARRVPTVRRPRLDCADLRERRRGTFSRQGSSDRISPASVLRRGCTSWLPLRHTTVAVEGTSQSVTVTPLPLLQLMANHLDPPLPRNSIS